MKVQISCRTKASSRQIGPHLTCATLLLGLHELAYFHVHLAMVAALTCACAQQGPNQAHLDVLGHTSFRARLLPDGHRRVVKLWHNALLVAHLHNALGALSESAETGTWGGGLLVVELRHKGQLCLLGGHLCLHHRHPLPSIRPRSWRCRGALGNRTLAALLAVGKDGVRQ